MRSSASTYMVRNFHTRNVRPSWPTRGWRKNTGPGSESRMPIAMTSSSGLSTQQAQERRHPVQQVLRQPARAGEGRLLDVQQRQALDRADVHPRAGDVGELRRDHQVDAGALELPGQPAQLAGLGAGRAADRDGVGADLADQGQHVAAGVHRDRGLDATGGRVAVGDVDGHRDQAGGRAAGDRGVDLERLGQRADQDHPVRAVAGAPAGQVQHLAGEVPAEQDEHQRADRDQGDRAAGQLGLGGERRAATRRPRP